MYDFNYVGSIFFLRIDLFFPSYKICSLQPMVPSRLKNCCLSGCWYALRNLCVFFLKMWSPPLPSDRPELERDPLRSSPHERAQTPSPACLALSGGASFL